MTRLSKQKSGASKARKPHVSRSRSGYWLLQDAKARFSELVRKARSEGPQHVTVHGRDEVVVIAPPRAAVPRCEPRGRAGYRDRMSRRLNSSHPSISEAVL